MRTRIHDTYDPCEYTGLKKIHRPTGHPPTHWSPDWYRDDPRLPAATGPTGDQDIDQLIMPKTSINKYQESIY